MEESQLLAYDLQRVDDPQAPGVRVGDSIHFRMIQPGLDRSDPSLKLEVPKTLNLPEEGWYLDPQSLTASPLKPGKLVLPPLSVQDASGKVVGHTQPFSLEVASAIASTDPHPEQPEGMRPPVGVLFPFWIVLVCAVLGGILLGGIAYGLYRAYQRRRPKVSAVSSPIVPADEKALQQLQALAQQKYADKGEFKKHYFTLSEILKEYVGARYRVDALESTTYEMIQCLEGKRALTDQSLDQLEAIFQQLDRVKFTDHLPTSDEAQFLWEEARKFVILTRVVKPLGAPVNDVQ